MTENLVRRPNAHGALLLVLVATFASLAASAQLNEPQNPAPPQTGALRPLAFEVVSIKPNKSGSLTRSVSYGPEGLRAVNMRLDLFVDHGFRLQQVFGAPAWLQSEGYDFEAKVADSDLAVYKKASPAEFARMLHDVLVDRLKLKDHQEMRELPTYSLVIAKNGSKLKEVKPGNTYADGARLPSGNPTGPGVFVLRGLIAGERRIVGQSGSIADLVAKLSYMPGIDRMVIDKTRLSGKYDFNLEWTPESTSPETDTGTSILTAIQEQLGLKLEPDKGPVPVLVIDHIERPSAN